MICKIPASRITFLLLALLVSNTANANLVQNGSFENGSHVDDGANYMRLVPGDTALLNWDIANEVAWGLSPTDGFSASVGVGFVDLSSFGRSSPNGTVQQILGTSIGTQYLFSYDSRGASSVNIDSTELLLSAGSTSNNWTSYTSVFTATSALSLLAIENNSGSVVVFIDNVSITELDASAVPVPAALWLFGTAAIGLFGIRKRRKVAS